MSKDPQETPDTQNGTEATMPNQETSENDSDLKQKGKKGKAEDSLQEELDELKDKYLRLFAEFDNYKKRTVKERLDLMKTAGQETIQSLLPVLDDFDRAKKSAESDKSAEVFSEGVAMVYKRLYHILEQQGLKSMESNGIDFNPELHEAISEIPAGQAMKGKVIDTVEKGYTLNDKIIRYAKVVVGS
ncbi:MAG TPA: nucleotide exchange factor GrpE [Saprospiraceae bacterium]|mgnify:FL=1|nr:nucleotide exchange factor GrpE [Saprospiraceae bacterium]HPG05886.1 nucleotide exchange factor GrpE [Saprospiraceae bacterium]HRV83413.1 nucleotide exchange factor GrpE [Saprospiraceae bacterium]